jgi:hypothetical protein
MIRIPEAAHEIGIVGRLPMLLPQSTVDRAKQIVFAGRLRH